ncbi:uncharacterized protein PHACADRAFT_258800 [Phanerochaete carnosa HHB-10118-sp]|uniref:Protein BIG1 n=1 Tax=Phanerochaete carnosa (strain HHB-10118-sp) TaxID=650164 RepID=K5W718_PHACS|nr:uncharacterized protein PHACADRAFT_258800 [Phanerochaete carnosa HHB-10118-sp]EKM54754.1 hypothetical protein PHACADRAFT_258800 [Phanerochaete carnosa HHB-10118-sp]
MRLSAFPLLLAGASLAQYATASPIRVVVVTSKEEISTDTRYDQGRPFVAEIVRPFAPLPEVITPHPGAGRHPCSKFKNKALTITNKFREAFGLPLIHSDSRPNNVDDESDGILRTLPFIGIPMEPIPVRPDNFRNKNDGTFNILPVPFQPGPGVIHVAPGRGMGHGRHRFQASFLHRVHRALMVLGPWEGRAVAFVLGCGIGVLLRMVWVMAILFARAFRSSRRSDDEDVHDVLVFEADAEEMLVPPPQYTDEKVALVVAEEKPEIKA